jgi:hypothetical protein
MEEGEEEKEEEREEEREEEKEEEREEMSEKEEEPVEEILVEEMFFSTGGNIETLEEEEEEDQEDQVVEEPPLPVPTEIILKLSNRGCGILFGGREEVGLADEIEWKFGVMVKGIDRERLPGCNRRVAICRRRVGGDVAGAAIQLFEEINSLAGSDLLFPAISW